MFKYTFIITWLVIISMIYFKLWLLPNVLKILYVIRLTQNNELKWRKIGKINYITEEREGVKYSFVDNSYIAELLITRTFNVRSFITIHGVFWKRSLLRKAILENIGNN